MGHLELVVNWALGVLLQGVDRFVIVSVDEELVAALRQLNIPAIAMRTEWLTPPGTRQLPDITGILSKSGARDASNSGGKFYKRLTQLKLLAVMSLLRSGRAVHINDDDIGWLDDGSRALERFEAELDLKKATLVAMSDTDKPLTSMNTGQYIALPRTGAMRILRAGLENDVAHDQAGIIAKSGHLMHLKAPFNSAGDGRIVDTWVDNSGTWSIGSFACNGHKKKHHSSVHANYVIGVDRKVACLKRNKAWHLPGGEWKGSIAGEARESIIQKFSQLPVHDECGHLAV